MSTIRQPGRKELSHQRIVDAAARAIRREGFAGVGVADIMKEAGLTHGGFYAHFASKDELVAEWLQAGREDRRDALPGRLAFRSCSEPEWKAWVSSGRAGLLEFAPLMISHQTIWGLNRIQAELASRGFEGELSRHFKSDRYQISDWDFGPDAWQHWSRLAVTDAAVWSRVFERLAGQPASFWTPAVTARALHVSQQNTTRLLTQAPLLPRWILRLREVPCLVDTHGRFQKPGDLLRRTPATEPLLDVEPFVHGRLDTEANRPLLDLLGVRSTPTGPRRLLACLRALAMSDQPPVAEVDKWYRRLDQLLSPRGDRHAVHRSPVRSPRSPGLRATRGLRCPCAPLTPSQCAS